MIAAWLMAVRLAAASAPHPAEAPPGPVYPAQAVQAIQVEDAPGEAARYDWGPCVMRDRGLYRMWWVRLGGGARQRRPYATSLPDGEAFSFTYPDRGDRVYYAESRDGRTWNLGGEDYCGSPDDFGPDAAGPLMVLGPAESAGERMHVGSPSVIRVQDRYYMYYESCGEFIVRRDPAGGRPVVGDEYHNQVMLAESSDGRTWHKHPDDRDPQPVIPAPDDNRRPERQRYGLGQPSVCWRAGRFILHYVDSCTGRGDFVVRVEADNPRFERATVFRERLNPRAGAEGVPQGAVARFAQMDVKYLGPVFYLVRPVYGEGRLGLLASSSGVFAADADVGGPSEVFPQIGTPDPRGQACRTRLFPRFLTSPVGEILVEDGRVVVYYSSGMGFKEQAHTWDLRRAEIPLRALLGAAR